MLARVIEQEELEDYQRNARINGSIFHSPEWYRMFGDRLVLCGLYNSADDLQGGFALFSEDRLGFRVLRDPPFTPFCGPFINIESQKPVTIRKRQREAIEAMAEFLDKQRCALLYVCLPPTFMDTLPFSWKRFKVTPHYTYRLDLSHSLEEIRNGMSSVRRRNIRKAQNDGLTTRPLNDPSVVRGLVRRTFGRQAKRIRTDYLDSILFEFATPENSYAFATYRGDYPIACCFVVHDQDTAYYLLGGYAEDEKHHGAGVAAMFEAIRQAQSLGLKTFDFEGSIIPPIEKYFREFGGVLTPYFAITRAWLPLEMVLKLVKREIF